MKKMMMMAVLVASATAAFAQDAKEQAKQWDATYKECYKVYEDNSKIQLTNQTEKKTVPFDTLAMYKGGVDALKAILKCDEYDATPDEKGRVKPKYRSVNQAIAQNLRIVALQAGQYYSQDRKDNKSAFDAWSLYVDSHDAPLFTGVDLSKDQYYAQFAYYSGLLAYQLKDYAAAEKYAKKCQEVAGDDEKLKKDAGEIILFAKKDGCKTAADSTAFVAELKELHKANPTEDRYFNMLLQYYNEHSAEKLAWITEETSLNPQNKMVWAIKGETEMRAEKWDDAIASYKKAIEIDPNFVAVVFNIGTSLNSKAVDLKDKLADKKTGALTVANANKVKAILEEAKTYLLKAKDLDPERKTVNWAYALYQVYYSLGDKANSATYEKLANQ